MKPSLRLSLHLSLPAVRARRRLVALAAWASLAVLVGCGSEPPAAADTAETGGATLTVVAPGLWPPAEGSRVRLVRGPAGGAPEVVGEYSTPPEPLRVAALTDVAAWVGVELVDAQGALIAAGRSAVQIIASDEVDRAVTVFLHARGAARPLVGVDGAEVALPARVGSTATALADGSVVVAGGAGGESGLPCAGGAPATLEGAVQRLELADHSLTTVATLSQPRAFHAAAALPGGRVAFVGGYVKTGGQVLPSPGIEILQANQGTLQSPAFELSAARARHCMLAIGGRLLVVGGEGPGATTAELWDPGSGTVATATLSGPRRHPSCTLVTNPVDGAQLVLVVGGATAGGASASATTFDEVLQIDGSKLTSQGYLPGGGTRGRFEAATGMETPLGVLRAGGLGPSGPLSRVTWLDLTQAAGSWKAADDLSAARACGAVGVVGSQLIVAGGGVDATSGGTAALDIIDLIDKNTVSVALPAARAGGWVQRLPSGAALIGGGTAANLVTTLP